MLGSPTMHKNIDLRYKEEDDNHSPTYSLSMAKVNQSNFHKHTMEIKWVQKWKSSDKQKGSNSNKVDGIDIHFGKIESTKRGETER